MEDVRKTENMDIVRVPRAELKREPLPPGVPTTAEMERMLGLKPLRTATYN